MKYLVATTALIIVGLIATLALRLGYFKNVSITEGERGPVKMVFKKHVGAYHLIVPVIEEVETWAKTNGEACKISFGAYIDDPDKVAEDRLQSNGGCIVERAWDFVLPKGFFYSELLPQLYVIAEFDGAPSIGPLRVYPKAKEYIEAHGYKQIGPTIELYEILSPSTVKTTYWFPVAKK